MALLTFGEGYHNYHHEFQHDYRNGVKPWNFDPTKWLIWLLEKMGLVSSLRRVPASKILLAEMAEARRRADQRLAELEASEGTVCERAMEAVHELLEKLAANYHALETALAEKVEMSRHVIAQWRRETRELMTRLAELQPSLA